MNSLFVTDQYLQLPDQTLASKFFGTDFTDKLLNILTGLKYRTFVAVLVFIAFCLHWFPLFYIINVNWAYLITVPPVIIIIFPTWLLVDLQIITHLFRTFDFWYVLLNGFAFCVELALLFRDARWIFVWSEAMTVLWACCMDAMPKSLRRFASIVTLTVLSSLVINLVCVHYSFYPHLHDSSFVIHGTTWTLKQIFSTSCMNATLYLKRYTLLAIWKPTNLFMITARIIPIERWNRDFSPQSIRKKKSSGRFN